jgi:hypothetical protein
MQQSKRHFFLSIDGEANAGATDDRDVATPGRPRPRPITQRSMPNVTK